MPTAKIQIKGILEGLPGGSVNIGPVDIVNTNSPQSSLDFNMVEGDNLIPIPSGAKGLIIIFDQNSIKPKTLKPEILTRGVSLATNGINMITVPPSLTYLYINLSALPGYTEPVTIVFF